MRTASINEFYSAIGSLLRTLSTASRRRYSLNTHKIYAPRARAELAALRKSFLLAKRDYPEERFPRVAFQIATIGPLVDKLVELFPSDSPGMLRLLRELSFKADSDLAAELDSLDSVPTTETEAPFLPHDLIAEKHYVLQKVLWEANKSYDGGCYNSCAAMLRRLIESLVIEAFEHHGIADNIKKDGEYLEFGALIGKATAEPKLRLTRNTKRILPDVKFFGDVGAHNRLMLVRKPDLDRLHQAVRSGVEELYRNV